MGPTKTQLLEELKNQGIDEETRQMIAESLQELPEQLGAEDIKRADEVLAEFEEVEKISAYVHEQLADTLERASDDLSDAADDFVERSAKTTYDNVKLARDLSE